VGPRAGLGGPQSRAGRCAVEEILCPFRELNLGRPSLSPSLYRLSYKSIVQVICINYGSYSFYLFVVCLTTLPVAQT
jgi:hypothetical protein